MNEQFVIGKPGHPWGPAEFDVWRSQRTRRRSYRDEVVAKIEGLRDQFDVRAYGEIAYADERYVLYALRSLNWDPALPTALITGGVHGYETSGVQGALQFLARDAARYQGRINLVAVPCVSPWAYERIHRWNFDGLDPNRSFREASTAKESAALMQLVAPLRGTVLMHIDLHETTDSDETEFRPALAARDGKAHEPGEIPDGFYLVDDSDNPQPEFQRAIIAAVEKITHIAPADAHGEIIGSKVIDHGVIQYAVKSLGLCTSISDAKYTTITEVYPDSARTSPAQCNDAQAAAVCAALDFVLSTAHKR